MSLDREVCLCFHVSQRKLLNFIRVEKPRHPSQLSECYGAGTGCGWCRPFLKKMFEQAHSADSMIRLPQTEVALPPPASTADPVNSSQSPTAPVCGKEEAAFWNDLAAEDYAAERASYLKQGKGRPPG